MRLIENFILSLHYHEKDLGYWCKRFRGKPLCGEVEEEVHHPCPRAWGNGHHGRGFGGAVLHGGGARCGGASGGDIEHVVLRTASRGELPRECGGGVQRGTGFGKVWGETGVLLQRPGV